MRHLGHPPEHHVVDQVLDGVHQRFERVNALSTRCREEGVMAGVSLRHARRNHATLDRFDGMPLLTYTTAPADEMLLGIRRLLDIVLAILALVPLAPLMAVVALAMGSGLAGQPCLLPPATRGSGAGVSRS